MAAELRDLRLKITVETDIWLDAEAKATGIAKPEFVRDLLHKQALIVLEKSRYVTTRAAAEGISGQSGEKR